MKLMTSSKRSPCCQCDSLYTTRFFGFYLKGTKLWIIMEYLGRGSALDLLKPGPMEETYIATILRDILKGLVYLQLEPKILQTSKSPVCCPSKAT